MTWMVKGENVAAVVVVVGVGITVAIPAVVVVQETKRESNEG